MQLWYLMGPDNALFSYYKQMEGIMQVNGELIKQQDQHGLTKDRRNAIWLIANDLTILGNETSQLGDILQSNTIVNIYCWESLVTIHEVVRVNSSEKETRDRRKQDSTYYVDHVRPKECMGCTIRVSYRKTTPVRRIMTEVSTLPQMPFASLPWSLPVY